ncbi:MAG TPA: A24 family peptidase [Candidatus Baltobacteraceae bacterium]
MSPFAVAVLAGSWCALPWAARRGLAELGESPRCYGADYGIVALGAVASLACFLRGDPAGAALCAGSGICVVTDIRHGVVLDSVLLVSTLAIGFVAVESKHAPAAALGCAAALCAMGLVLALSRGAMGLGDLKFAGVIGLALGVDRGLLALAIAFAAGGLVAAVLMAAGRVRRGQALPFAPFLAIGATAMACGLWAFARVG